MCFLAELRGGKGKKKGMYEVKGCVEHVDGDELSFFDNVNVNRVGANGWKLRLAQLGLMSYWSLLSSVATIVPPTGTGKTETMLATSVVDKAERTLVIVPTIHL